MSAKMIFADIDPPGALTTRGDVEIKGTAGVYGDNLEPPGWSGYCGGFDTNDMPGIVTDGSGTVTTSGKTAEYDGNPPSVVDPAIVDATFTDFGNLTWPELVANWIGGTGVILLKLRSTTSFASSSRKSVCQAIGPSRPCSWPEPHG